MALSQSIVRYLRSSGIAYDVLPRRPFGSVAEAARSAHIPLDAFAQGHLLSERGGLVMVVIPASATVDMPGINPLLGRTVSPATEWQITKLINDGDGRFVPAMGDAYGIRTLVDERHVSPNHQQIHIVGGNHTHLLRFGRRAFLNLQEKAFFAQDLGKPPPPPGVVAPVIERRAEVT